MTVGGDVPGILSTGPNAVNIQLLTGPPVSSAYLQQVQRIAPAALHGREAELAELAAFCLGDGDATYVWWRAAAWSGKSALMSWFTLYPPDGVTLVPFFVTARLAGQSDRAAFIDVVLEQLATLLGEPMPAYLTPATREAHLLAFLEQAAARCRRDGRRLVLLVDGLDEDLGATSRPDAHSIAALLPARPPAGLRVIVAGRLNPPVPADVPEHHPLRDQRIVRPLRASPHAAAVRQDAERELLRLLEGSPTEQDLLGLLTTARGGLSSADLSELTAEPGWRIDKALGTVSGRTFGSRAGHWVSAVPVFVLGHEELQQQATAFLGARRIEELRQRLHAWADGYRDNGWPPGTPEYLLRGYHRLLNAADDLPRMIACATDRRRHDRMTDISGGDAAALAEITTTIDVLLRQPAIDLTAVGRVAVHRDALIGRNSAVPIHLPALWARLGRFTRAEALARTSPAADRRAEMLAALVPAMAAAGDPDRALRVAVEAEALARTIPAAGRRAVVLAGIAQAMAAAGDPHRAERLAGSIDDPVPQGEVAASSDLEFDVARVMVVYVVALADVAEALAAAGHTDGAVRLADRAEVLARTIPDLYPALGGEAMAGVVRALAFTGDIARADALARTIDEPEHRAAAFAGAAPMTDRADPRRYQLIPALTAIAEAMAAAGNPAAALRITGDCDALARAVAGSGRQSVVLATVTRVIDSGEAMDMLVAAGTSAGTAATGYAHDWTLADVALVAAVIGEPDRAEALARTISDEDLQAETLTDVALATAAGDPDRAARFAEAAEALARSTADPYEKANFLVEAARAMAVAGDADRAEVLARAITDVPWQVETLDRVAQAVTAAGDPGRALRIAADAEALARTTDDMDWQDRVLAGIARTVAAAGAPGRAEALARTIPILDQQITALAGVALAVAAGDPTDALRIARDAEALARTMPNPLQQMAALAAIARAVAAVGDVADALRIARDAEDLARTVPELDWQIPALAVIAGGLAAGAPEHAIRLADEVEELARTIIDNTVEEALAVPHVVWALADLGAGERTEALARAIPGLTQREDLLADVAERTAATDPRRAEALARTIIDPDQQARALVGVAAAAAPQDACRLIGDALRISPARLSLAAIASRNPAGAIAVVDEYLRSAGEMG